MASMSQYERAAVERRVATLKRAICELGLLNLETGKYSAQMRLGLAEIRQLQIRLEQSVQGVSRGSARNPAVAHNCSELHVFNASGDCY